MIDAAPIDKYGFPRFYALPEFYTQQFWATHLVSRETKKGSLTGHAGIIIARDATL